MPFYSGSVADVGVLPTGASKLYTYTVWDPGSESWGLNSVRIEFGQYRLEFGLQRLGYSVSRTAFGA